MSSITLESFVSTIRNLYHALQSGANQITISYSEIYHTINTNLDIFNENANNLLENVLPVFTLPEYTLPHMAVLYGIVSQIQKVIYTALPTTDNLNNLNQDQLLNDIENCIKLSDEKQVEYAVDIFSELCHFYTTKLCQSNRPKRGLVVIRDAIKKLQKDPNSQSIKKNSLTTVHSDLLQLALASKNLTIGLELISNEILDIHKPANSSFDSKYLLSYFYYSGCIYTAMKQFDSALFYFEQVLTVPASSISQIMTESYKKFLLVSLISKGKLPSLPKYTSRIVINQIKPICSIYHELANAFINYEMEKLNSICTKYQDLFETDKNYGLIKQLQQSLYKKNIQKLTKTFITLSLADMATKVKLPSAKEAETYMLNMIKDGEIFATINQKDGMVSFHDNPEKYDNPTITEHLTKQMFECIQIDTNIKEMDKEITTHPHYIQKCQSSTNIVGDDGTDQLIQSSSVSALRQQQMNSYNDLKIS